MSKRERIFRVSSKDKNDWLETNSLSDSAISLWHALMHINNRAGGIPEFAVAISTLIAKTGLKKDAIIRARLCLQQLGRVDFRSRSGQQSTVYKIIPFESEYQTQTTTQDTCVGLNDTTPYKKQEQTTTQPATERSTQTTSIIKQNTTRQNEMNNDISLQPSLNISKLINNFSLTYRGVSDVDKLKSFVGHMERDLILEAFKRSEKKVWPIRFGSFPIGPKKEFIPLICLERVNRGFDPRLITSWARWTSFLIPSNGRWNVKNRGYQEQSERNKR